MNKCTDILNDSIWKHAIEIPLYIFVPFKTRVPERSVISLQLIQQFSFQRLFFYPVAVAVHYMSFVDCMTFHSI